MRQPGETTTDAVEILRRRFVEGQPEMEEALRDARLSLSVAQQIHDLRTEARLTQRELAARVGTTASVICRLEDADYDGKQSLQMLLRVASALGHRVEIRLVPNAETEKKPANQRRAKAKG